MDRFARLLAIAASCIALHAAAQAPDAAARAAAASPEAAIRAALKAKFPEAPVDGVRKVPYSNLFEVVSSGEIFYTDDKATFLVVGSIIDAKSKENVTEKRLRQVNAVKFDALPLDAAIKIVRGNGSRRMAMFEDPNCGYCKKIERDIAAMNDVTVYIFLYPILAQDSMDKSRAVWCAPDRAKAWLDLMLRDVNPAGDGKCDTPIERILAFGRDKRIQGTPTIFFEDGERLPGAVPVAEIEKRLAQAAPAGTKRN